MAQFSLEGGKSDYSVDSSTWFKNDAETIPRYVFSRLKGWNQQTNSSISPLSRFGRCPRAAQYGQVHIQAWPEMHAKPDHHATRGTYQPRPLIHGTLIRIMVQKLPKPTHEQKPLWFWWHGPTLPDLERIWQAYHARFQLEHFFKFAKYQLNWTTPRVCHPDQADRWTHLVLLAYTMMRLARPVVSDQHLPWERPLSDDKRTPYRVRQGLSLLVLSLPRVTNPPKTLWSLAWPTERREIRASTALSRHHKERLSSSLTLLCIVFGILLNC